jgi:anaerobic ribonucleoside-triphosphate reductase
MIFEYSYDKEFKDIFTEFQKNPKYQALLNLDGIGWQLDVHQFSKNFFKGNNVADISVDSNANVQQKTVVQYENELAKPIFKLNSYYLLWRYGKKLYGKETAKELIDAQFHKDIYINDMHSYGLKPYCYNFSCLDIVFMGLPFVDKIETKPPKHLSSFIGHILSFVTYSCNQVAGAVGLADLFICCSYFTKGLPIVQIKQELQAVIYQLNQPFRSSYQSPFTNVSIFDKVFLERLCNEYTFPDGSKPEVREVKRIQKIFVSLMNDTLRKSAFTFPITTACFAVDSEKNILDKDFLKYISEVNKEFGFMNIYAGKTSTLSSCCFDKDQKILCKSSYGVLFDSFENIYNLNHEEYKKNFTIFHNGSWVRGKLVKYENIGDSLIKIMTSNNKSFSITQDHIVPTYDGDKKAIDLTSEDYVLFNNMALNTFAERDLKLTYEQGFLLGLYLGDGSKYKKPNSESYTTTFSLNEKDYKTLPIVKQALEDWGIEKEVHIHYTKNNVMFFIIYSKKLFNVISEYVYGNYSYEKELNLNILLQSQKFRHGILDGWYQSDGGNSNRIYSTSSKLIEHGELLCTSLGINTTIDISDRTGEGKFVIRGRKFNRNHPLYCLRWYNAKNKRSMKEVYKVKNNSIYFKIKNIEEVEYKNEDVYCCEIKNLEEPYFTLPNGHITHNCRLRSDNNNEYFNMFGSGGTQIGSCSVTTVNLPRIAYVSRNEEEFFAYLQYRVNLAFKSNRIRRYIVERRIKQKHAPLYQHGFMNLKKQYLTCGLVGINEACEIMGKDILTEEGQIFVERMLETVNYVNEECQKKYKMPINCEQTPSENCISGDTIIKTIYGDEKIKNLVGEQIPVFSFDINTRKPVIKLAKNIRKTVKQAEVFRVWFDNNTYIDCTDNHKFAKNFKPEGKNKGVTSIKWVEAKNLKKRDSIRFLDKREDKRIYYIRIQA